MGLQALIMASAALAAAATQERTLEAVRCSALVRLGVPYDAAGGIRRSAPPACLGRSALVSPGPFTVSTARLRRVQSRETTGSSRGPTPPPVGRTHSGLGRP